MEDIFSQCAFDCYMIVLRHHIFRENKNLNNQSIRIKIISFIFK